MRSVLVAYSGGVDSTFLIKVAADVLGGNVLAVTAISPTYPRQELALAKKMAGILGVRHKVIKTRELKNKIFTANTPGRCYYCKRELFSNLKKIADREGIRFVLDATNASDIRDYRPGNKAKKELGVRSPLQEAGLGKKDIRRLSKNFGLLTWDKPSLACLASRIPYGIKISLPILRRIEKAEEFLKQKGFTQVRLRDYNGLCRIEVPLDEIPRIIAEHKAIVDKLKGLGYHYVTVDLEGYRSGSMNLVLRRKARQSLS